MKNKPLVALLLLAFLACEGEIIGLKKNEVAIVAEVEHTKPNSPFYSWVRGDVIGVYTKSTGQSLSSAALAKNSPYVSDGSSAFKAASDYITWPGDGSSIDFIAYFPYQEVVEGFTIPVDLTNQYNQGAIGLMYSENGKACNADTPMVELQFSHQLSKIILHVTPPQGLGVDGMVVALTGAGTKATFDLTTGRLSAPEEEGDILLHVYDGTGWVEGTLLPTEDVSEMSIWFFLPGMPHAYRYPLDESLQISRFDPSTRYTFHVTLVDDQTLVLTHGTILGWEEGPIEHGIALPEDKKPPVSLPGTGTFNCPYTVKQAQKKENLGKMGVWVEGYLVGSVDGTMNKFIPGNNTIITSNIAIADNPNETDKAFVMPVNLTEGTPSTRDALNLWSHPWNLNRKIKLLGDIEPYFLVPGLRKPREYTFVDLSELAPH